MAAKQGKNKSNKESSEQNVTTGFVQLKVKDRKNRSSNGRIPTALTTRLYKQTDETLFTDEDIKKRDRLIAERTEIFGFLKDSSVFENSTIRTLFSLCFCLYSTKNVKIFLDIFYGINKLKTGANSFLANIGLSSEAGMVAAGLGRFMLPEVWTDSTFDKSYPPIVLLICSFIYSSDAL